MITVIALKDFQSHKLTKLTFEPGLTVINGSNSSGKSAVLRALKSLILNSPYCKKFIRNGADKATVALKLQDYPQIYWQRTNESASYKVGENTFTKIGRNQIYDILPDFPFMKDESGAILNIHDEWSVIFPFDRSSTDLFRLFEHLFSSTPSNSVIDEIRRDELELKRKKTENEALIKQTRTKIDLINSTIESIDLDKLERAKIKVKEFFDFKEQAGTDLLKAQSCLDVLNLTFIDCPDMSPVGDALTVRSDYNRLVYLSEICGVSFSDVLPSMNELDKLFDLYSDLMLVLKWNEVSSVSFCDAPSEDLDFLFSLDCDLRKVLSILGEIKLLTDNVSAMESEISSIEEELNSVDVCPLCERPF